MDIVQLLVKEDDLPCNK